MNTHDRASELLLSVMKELGIQQQNVTMGRMLKAHAAIHEAMEKVDAKKDN